MQVQRDFEELPPSAPLSLRSSLLVSPMSVDRVCCRISITVFLTLNIRVFAVVSFVLGVHLDLPRVLEAVELFVIFRSPQSSR